MKNILLLVLCVTSVNIYAQNIGIGTTTPAAKLHVVSTDTGMVRIENTTTLAAGVANALYFKTGLYFTGGIKHIGAGTNTSRTGFLGFASGNTNGLREYMSITDAGNVGIGTIAPTAKLHIQATGYGLIHSDATGQVELGTYVTTAGGWLGTRTKDQLFFFTNNGGPSMMLDTFGSVGIGNNGSLLGGLVVDKKIGAVNGIFGSNTTGISLESSFPSIGFNSYYNGSRKFMANGYGAVLGLNPINGTFTYSSSTVSGTTGTALTANDAMTISPAGAMVLGGSDAGYIFKDRTLTNYAGWNWYADNGSAGLYRYTSGGTLLTVDPNGNVGIGTTTPSGKLTITTNANAAGIEVNQNGSGLGGYFFSSGNVATYGLTSSATLPAAFFQGTNALAAIGKVGIGTSTPAQSLDIKAGRMRFTGQVSAGTASGIEFTNNAGTATRSFLGVYDDNTLGFYGFAGAGWNFLWDAVDGSVRIGTAQKATGYMLNVGGKIIAEEVRVQLRASWPDYVFKNDYRLMPLNEVENYIKLNNHLPGFEKAATMEKEGADVGETQRRLVEKVEELTLHLISINKRLEELEKENNALKNK